MPAEWDRPYSETISKEGDLSEAVLFTAVGQCLSRWEELEVNIATLFAVVTGSMDQWHYGPAIRAFGVVNSAPTRRDMILQAAEAFFTQLKHEDASKLFAEVKGALNYYVGWSGRRNDVAHGVVTESAFDPGVDTPDDQWEECFLLCPSYTTSKKWPIESEPAYNYRASEIEKFGEGFLLLSSRVSALNSEIEDARLASINAG
jgi:hypothetical protein